MIYIPMLLRSISKSAIFERLGSLLPVIINKINMQAIKSYLTFKINKSNKSFKTNNVPVMEELDQ